jgi:AraC-like DNA-binding protein
MTNQRPPTSPTSLYWRPHAAAGLDIVCAELYASAFPDLVREEHQIVLARSACRVTGGPLIDRFAPAGAIVLTNPFEPRGYAPHRDSCRLGALIVSAETIANAVGETTPRRFVDAVIDDSELAAKLDDILDRLRSSRDDETCESDLKSFLRSCFERHSQRSGSWGNASVSARIRRLARHLETNASRRISLDEMSQIAEVGKYHLLRQFRRECGMSPRAYQMLLRLARALRMLAGGASPSRAAYESGFADQSHLTRRLKQLTGFTPTEYARQTRSTHASASDWSDAA